MVNNVKYSSFLISLTETDKKTGESRTVENSWIRHPDPLTEALQISGMNFLTKKALESFEKTFKEYHRWCYSYEEDGKIYLNYIMGFVALPGEVGIEINDIGHIAQ